MDHKTISYLYSKEGDINNLSIFFGGGVRPISIDVLIKSEENLFEIFARKQIALADRLHD